MGRRGRRRESSSRGCPAAPAWRLQRVSGQMDSCEICMRAWGTSLRKAKMSAPFFRRYPSLCALHANTCVAATRTTRSICCAVATSGDLSRPAARSLRATSCMSRVASSPRTAGSASAGCRRLARNTEVVAVLSDSSSPWHKPLFIASVARPTATAMLDQKSLSAASSDHDPFDELQMNQRRTSTQPDFWRSRRPSSTDGRSTFAQLSRRSLQIQGI